MNSISAGPDCNINSKMIDLTHTHFPAKLYAILSNERFKNIITFSENGKSWKVIDKKLLETDVMPEYFKTHKYLSFTRNVLGWGFRRCGKATYYHELFCQGQPDKISQMLRIAASKLESMSKDEPSRIPKDQSNSSSHMIFRMGGTSSSNAPFNYTNQENKRNMKYLLSQGQIPYSQESISQLPILSNNNVANSWSRCPNMAPPVNLAPNCHQETMHINMIPSTGHYYHSYPVGIEDHSKARNMNADDSKPRSNNFLFSNAQHNALFKRTAFYPVLPHATFKNIGDQMLARKMSVDDYKPRSNKFLFSNTQHNAFFK